MSVAGKREAPNLIRGLGLAAATAVVIGSMIGNGIFLVSSQMARDIGSIVGVMAAWSVGGLVVLCGTFCYAELGAAIPEAGGDYLYLSRGLGPRAGFLFGWTSSLLMRPASLATIAAGLLRFAGFLLPSVATPIFFLYVPLPFHLHPSRFTFTFAQPIAAAVVVAVTAINYVGVRTAGRLQIFLTSLKAAAVAIIIVAGLTFGRVQTIHSALRAMPVVQGSGSAFLTVLVPVMAAYNGFQHVGSVGGEIINPEKNIPRAMIVGVLSVVTLYLLANLAYFCVLTFSQIAQSQNVASDVIMAVAGANRAKWLTVAMMVSGFGALHCGFLTGPRIPYAMARDGRFFSFAGQIHPAFHTPSGALLLQGLVTMVFVLTGTFEDLYSLSIFAISSFFVLTAIALIRLRIKEPTLPRPYRAWGYPWTPLVFAAIGAALTANLWWVRPVRSSIGMAVILLGIPFFNHWRKRASEPPSEN